MISIWNEVVEEGVAFPQEEYLTKESGRSFLHHGHIAVWPLTMTKL